MLAIIGFDTGSVPTLERMLEEGTLPALAELRRRGRWHRLERPPVGVEAGAYQTLYSGHHLSEHGLYFPFQWSAGEQRLRYIHDFSGPPAAWELLARAGRRSLVVDPYEGRWPDVQSGVFLSGWQFVNRFVLPRRSRPRGTNRHLSRRFGRPPFVEEVFGQPSTSGLRRLRRQLLNAPGRTADAIEALLRREQFDLLWINFPSAHVAGHRLWDLSTLDDDLEPAHRRELEGAVEETYRAVDSAIGRIVSVLPPHADLILFSASGMDQNNSRVDLLPNMLSAVLDGGRGGGKESATGGWIWRLRGALPSGLRGGAARLLPSPLLFELSARLELRGVDWSRTRAFPLPSDDVGYVRLNLRGRERDGIVEPDQADALMDEITEGLMTFTDPDGSPSVASVDRVSGDAANGSAAERLPDLIVRWGDRPAARLRGVRSSRYGEVQRHGGGSGRSGNHTRDAWAVVVPGASRTRATSRPPHIVDIAATACSMLGAERDGLPGEALLEGTGTDGPSGADPPPAS